MIFGITKVVIIFDESESLITFTLLKKLMLITEYFDYNLLSNR